MSAEEGDTFLKDKNYKQAIECYSAAIASDPKNIVLRQKRGEAYSGAGRDPELESDGYAAVRIDPTNDIGYYLLIRAYSKQGLYNDVDVLASKLHDSHWDIPSPPPSSKHRTEPIYFGACAMLRLCIHEKYGPELENPETVRDIRTVRAHPECIEEFCSKNPVISEMIDASIELLLSDEGAYFEELPEDFPSYRVTENSTVEFSCESPTQDAKEADLLRERGNELLKSERDTDAIAAYSEALSHCLVDQRLYGNRAAAFMNLRFYSLAIGDCEMALAIDEKYERVAMRRSQCYLYQNMKLFREFPGVMMLEHGAETLILGISLSFGRPAMELLLANREKLASQMSANVKDVLNMEGENRITEFYERLHDPMFRAEVDALMQQLLGCLRV